MRAADRLRARAAGLFVVALLSGRVLDRTTGQPLAGVTLSAGNRTTTTGKDGRYVLRGLHPGVLTLILQSNDVPAERIRLHVNAGANERDVRACSTTLDYGCGEAPAKSSATLPNISPIVG